MKHIINPNDKLYTKDLEMCFDEFERIGFSIFIKNDISNNRENFSVKIFKRKLKVGTILGGKDSFQIDHDIIDEIESSIGKSNEIGFNLSKFLISIWIYPTRKQDSNAFNNPITKFKAGDIPLIKASDIIIHYATRS